MEGEEKKDMYGLGSDHDLLIRLDTRFGDFEKHQRSSQDGITEKLLSLLSKMDRKVDKEDLNAVQSEMQKKFSEVDTRFRALEERNHAQDVQKDTVIKLGAGGIKLWHLALGAIMFLLTSISIVTNIIQALK